MTLRLMGDQVGEQTTTTGEPATPDNMDDTFDAEALDRILNSQTTSAPSTKGSNDPPSFLSPPDGGHLRLPPPPEGGHSVEGATSVTVTVVPCTGGNIALLPLPPSPSPSPPRLFYGCSYVSPVQR